MESVNGTSGLPPRVYRHARYRIAIVSFRCCVPRTLLATALDEIASSAFSRHAGPRLLFLPGAQRSWPSGTRKIAAVARQHKCAVLFEVAKQDNVPRVYRAVSSRGKLLPLKIYQAFSTSREADRQPEAVKSLVCDCQPGGRRTIKVSGLRVGLLVCGENNVLRNLQGDVREPNRVQVRGGQEIFQHVALVLNGAHTKMGNWGKLDRRFEFLSARGRWCFYTTNYETTWGKSAVRVYHDGRLIVDSKTLHDDALRGFVKFHSSADRNACALALDIEGARLT